MEGLFGFAFVRATYGISTDDQLAMSWPAMRAAGQQYDAPRVPPPWETECHQRFAALTPHGTGYARRVRILIATLVAAAVPMSGCLAHRHEPLSAADKLHLIDCRAPVMARVCPPQEDCESEARAKLEAVPPRDRLRWLEDNGCPSEVIVRREALLAQWQAEPKQPVSTGTRLRWQIGDAVSTLGCVLVLPLCLARQATRSP